MSVKNRSLKLDAIGGERRLWTWVLIFAAGVIVGLSLLAFRVHEAPPAHLQPSKTPLRAQDLLAPSAIHLQAFVDSPFSSAVDRLNHAFQNHPDRAVQEMVLLVNARTPQGQQPPCPLAWPENDATLSLQTDPLGKLSPTKAIDACADAVERLP